MSTYRADSEVARFNATATTQPVAVSTTVTAVVSAALDLAARSGGAFDPTFEPVFKLWGFGTKGPRRAPQEDDLAATMARCGYAHLHADGPGLLRKDIPGLAFNLNAIAPGYASDRIASLLLRHGLTNVYVDVAGEIFARGHNLRGVAWRVGIEKPDLGAAAAEGLEEIVPLQDRALSTSGDYRNFFTNDEGRVFSHLFDPRHGRPATGTVGSVSVVAPTCALADGLATTLFVLGPEDGLPFLTNFPGAEALFIVRRGDGTYTESRSAGFGEGGGANQAK